MTRSAAARKAACYSAACCLTICLGLLCAAALRAAAPTGQFPPPQRDYILACGGCHGLNGVSNPDLVPGLQGLVGFYLNLPEGRAYLSRLPNVAFSTLSDERLAAVLNYVVFDIGAGSVPPEAPAYRAAEVGKWRKQPLTEVTLSAYRRGLVDTLIKEYRAPEALRGYSATAAQ
jgi:cytochrome c553